MVGRSATEPRQRSIERVGSGSAFADVEGLGQVKRSQNIAGADQVANHIEINRGRAKCDAPGVIANQTVTRHDRFQVGLGQVAVDRVRRCQPESLGRHRGVNQLGAR